MIVAVFSLSLFLSATLLFLIQPMLAKMILPMLGGAPAVWNTTMVFFQAVLLCGYLYAHYSIKWLGARRQSLLHVVLLALAALTLPVTLPAGASPPESSNPVAWLLLLLLVSVGPVAFLVSATAPMMQRWFSLTTHKDSEDPYFLYSASNLGSMTALFGYPTVIEPLLSSTAQSRGWAGGFLLLSAGIFLGAVAVYRSGTGAPAATVGKENGGGAPPAAEPRLRWFLLSFTPSSLLLGVTTFITTDIAAVPFLWVLPLGLYLLTFVLVFARRPIVSHRLMVSLLPFLLVPLVALAPTLLSRNVALFPLHLAAFFVTAMVCHGELVRLRPSAEGLTSFYLWMSVGGLVGGLFNSLLAPLVFKTVVEYSLAMVLAAFLYPAPEKAGATPRSRRADVLIPLALVIVALALPRALTTLGGPFLKMAGIAVVVAAAVTFTLLSRRRALRFKLAVLATLLAVTFVSARPAEVVLRERNFFGVITVSEDRNGATRLFLHGTTLHGAQLTDPGSRMTPITYYAAGGPFADAMRAFRSRATGGASVAVLGLGTGTAAAYGLPGDIITFFELDPAVARIAGDPKYFTFLSDSPAEIRTVIGDARLKLAASPDRSFDLIILDVFSSDAIPVHLLTREAFRLYAAKLTPGGMIVCNITNKHMALENVFGDLAGEAGWTCLLRSEHASRQGQDGVAGISSGSDSRHRDSKWLVLARSPADLGVLPYLPNWTVIGPRPGRRLWTDDYSNIFSVLAFI